MPDKPDDAYDGLPLSDDDSEAQADAAERIAAMSDDIYRHITEGHDPDRRPS